MLCFVALQNALEKLCNFFLRNAVSSEIEVAYSEDLYDFSGTSVEAFIKRINPKLSNVFIFGHNNALTALVNQMGNQHIDNIPTCGIVKINFKSKTWCDCSKGTIEFQLFPKNLTT